VKPSREAIRAALQIMADGLNAEDPERHYFVPEPGEPLPPGARLIRVTGDRRGSRRAFPRPSGTAARSDEE
jgi:hypothetical protein